MNKLLLFITIILLISNCLIVSAENLTMETINLSEMSLKEKVGQLMIVKPEGLDSRYINELHVGGIFLNDLKSEPEYKRTISYYKNISQTNLFIATDMEGYWNPFSNFYSSKNLGEVSDEQESYDLGIEHGKTLNELGFNLDFSPVVESRNEVWPGRSFEGTPEEIQEKVKAYIQGLHREKILATAKHYPGGSLVKNPHLLKFKAEIFPEDLEYFDVAISEHVDAIMVGHPIVYGAVDSNGKQATISREVLSDLRNKFEGLIITDAVTMLGLRLSYPFNFKKVYPVLISSGNDIILDTHKNSGYKALKKRRDEIIKAVDKGYLPESLIDEKVKRILEKKGHYVVE
ncbi:MAG: hypothetical protein KC516_01965 [Nanoarchaeota archaeon]|nr:hypothetical protein [Nanoarchaeota archaeon]